VICVARDDKQGEACQILVSYLLLPGTNYWKREIAVMPDKEPLLAETLVLYQNEMRPYASRTLPHLEIHIWMGKWKGFWPVGAQFEMPRNQRSERGMKHWNVSYATTNCSIFRIGKNALIDRQILDDRKRTDVARGPARRLQVLVRLASRMGHWQRDVVRLNLLGPGDKTSRSSATWGSLSNSQSSPESSIPSCDDFQASSAS
jgi:hypothetical protein